MSSAYISFAHVKSESADDYYFAIPGYRNINDEADRQFVLEEAERLTGEDIDCLYIEALDGVSPGLNDTVLL